MLFGEFGKQLNERARTLLNNLRMHKDEVVRDNNLGIPVGKLIDKDIQLVQDFLSGLNQDTTILEQDVLRTIGGRQ